MAVVLHRPRAQGCCPGVGWGRHAAGPPGRAWRPDSREPLATGESGVLGAPGRAGASARWGWRGSVRHKGVAEGERMAPRGTIWVGHQGPGRGQASILGRFRVWGAGPTSAPWAEGGTAGPGGVPGWRPPRGNSQRMEGGRSQGTGKVVWVVLGGGQEEDRGQRREAWGVRLRRLGQQWGSSGAARRPRAGWVSKGPLRGTPSSAPLFLGVRCRPSESRRRA